MNTITITDYYCEELDIYTRMNETQLRHIYEPELGGFIAESPNVITRALNAGFEPISMLVEEGSWDEKQPFDDREEAFMRDVAFEVMERVGNIPIFVANREALREHRELVLIRGAMCFMRRKQLESWRDLVERLCPKRIAVLEDVTNPTNLGAIFRSAAALGIDLVLLTGGCADPLYRRATRVSMGCVFQVNWTYISDIKEVLKDLEELGYVTAAMALDDRAVSITDSRISNQEKLAILLGAEGYGLKADTIDACSYTVMIPMVEGVDSLNVAAASAVAFWELRARRS